MKWLCVYFLTVTYICIIWLFNGIMINLCIIYIYKYRSRFKLSKEINYGDPIYKIFEKNPIVISKVKELIESKNDHLEFDDGYYKFSLKVERGLK